MIKRMFYYCCLRTRILNGKIHYIKGIVKLPLGFKGGMASGYKFLS